MFEEVAGSRRRVVLRASTAPFGGTRRKSAFNLGGELRSTRTYEPGNDKPVRHVFGSKERDLEVEGHLRDGLIGIDGEAERQRGLIEAIRRDGEELRILWNGLARRGVLAESEFGVEGGSDFVYKLRFEVDAIDDGADSAGRATPRTAFPTLDPSDMVGILNARLGAIVKVPGLSLDVAGAMLDLFGAITNPLAQLIGAFEDVEAGVEDIGDAYKRAVNAAAALMLRVQHLASTIGAVSDPTDTPDDGAAQAAWERQRCEALTELREVATRAQALGMESERRLRGATSGRLVTTADGDTIEAIAARERTTAEAIRALNPDVGFAPAVGTRLRLP